MLAIDLVNFDIPSLKTSDTIEKALQILDNSRFTQLAVTKDSVYVGMLDEDVLLEYEENQLIESVHPDMSGVSVMGFQHLYELLGTVSRYDLETLAVVDEEQLLIGSIAAADIYQRFAQQIGMYEPGAILVISLNNRDYSLSEISRLIEAENVKITSSYVSGNTQDFNNPLKVTLKLNKTDISAIISTLERFGYTVEAAYAHAPITNTDKDRYDMLMKYLSI